jgi:hypothetical protein
MSTIPIVVADFETSLAASVAEGATTATLTSATDSDGVALPTGNYSFTIDNNTDYKEYIICTLTGTALTAVQNISRQGAVTTGFANYHRQGATVEITDWASLSRMYAALAAGVAYNVVALTDAATIATDASLGNVFSVTLGGNRTFSNPTNPTNGQIIEYQLKQDGAGNRTAAWGTAFAWTTDVVLPTLSTTAAKIDFILFQYRSAESKWFALAVNKGAN